MSSMMRNCFMSMQSNRGLLLEYLVYHFKSHFLFFSYYLFLVLLILFSTSLLHLVLFEFHIVWICYKGCGSFSALRISLICSYLFIFKVGNFFLFFFKLQFYLLTFSFSSDEQAHKYLVSSFTHLCNLMLWLNNSRVYRFVRAHEIRLGG